MNLLLYTNTYIPQQLIVILKALSVSNSVKILPNPGQKCHAIGGYQPVFEDPEKRCVEQYYGNEIQPTDNESYFWLRGDLYNNYLVNGFGGTYYIILLWIVFFMIDKIRLIY